jgi:D-alanyl-D-alanine carboxypeptidase
MHLILLRVLTLLGLFLGAVAPLETVTADEPAGKPAASVAAEAGASTQPWDNMLASWITDPADKTCDAPGGVLLVDNAGGRYLKAAGVASIESRRAIDISDRFEIGSNTKSFTVVLALQLQEAGLLSMDDLLAKWLPGLAARIPSGERITLRQLAGNRSGIRDYADPLMQPLVDSNDQQGMAKEYAPAALVEYTIGLGAASFEPDDGWEYSSTNFILLGMVVETVTGRTLSELYQERIFDVLGMADSSYPKTPPLNGEMVNGYYTTPAGEQVDVTGWSLTQGGAAGGIISTAADMALYAHGLFNGKLFKMDNTLKEMTKFTALTLAQGAGIMQGYGLGLIAYGTDGFRAIGHSGQTPGFQTLWFYVPATESTLVFLTNSGSCPAGLMPMMITASAFESH